MRQLKLGKEAKDIEENARTLADKLRKELPENVGFTLFLFDTGKDPSTEGEARITYISTARREDMVKVIGTWLKKQAP